MVITWSQVAGLQYCLVLLGSQQYYKLFINYTQHLHVKSFLLAWWDLSFVVLGFRFPGMKFFHVMGWKSYLMHAYKKKEKNVCKSKEILAGKLSSFSVIKFISPCNCRMKFQLNRLKFHSSKLAAFVNIFDPICSSFNYFVMMCSQDCKIGWVALIVSKSFICKIVQVRYNNHWKGKPTIWEQ